MNADWSRGKLLCVSSRLHGLEANFGRSPDGVTGGKLGQSEGDNVENPLAQTVVFSKWDLEWSGYFACEGTH